MAQPEVTVTWFLPRFHKTEVSKRYVCLVHGRVSQAKGIVVMSLAATCSQVGSDGLSHEFL